MLYLFYIQVLEILDLEVLDFWLFTELAIWERFSTWNFKHARFCVCTHLQRNNWWLNLFTYVGECVDSVIPIQVTYVSLYPENILILLFMHKKHEILNVSYTVWAIYVTWLVNKRWIKWPNINKMNYMWNMGNVGNMIDFTVLNVWMFEEI